MDRMEEYKKLMSELDNVPMELSHTLTRAKSRFSKKRIFNWIAVPICSVISAAFLFVLMVNISPTFAYACEKIPFLNDLASAVKFSPSLSAAVENEFVQPVNLKQTENGITMKIEYVIVDQKQLNVFYTLSSEEDSNLDMEIVINDANGSKMQGFTVISYDNDSNENEELQHFIVDFIEQDMPSALQLQFKLYEIVHTPIIYKPNSMENASESENVSVIKEDSITEGTKTEETIKEDSITEGTITEETRKEDRALFTFLLEFDPSFTSQGQNIEINKTFVLDGQTLSIKNAKVYPTHMQFNLSADTSNTAWLTSLSFYVTDEEGNRFDTISKGILALGSTDSPMMESYRIESNFFDESKHLDIHITGAEWLDKDMERVMVNLKEKTAEKLPEGASFDRAIKTRNGWELTFSSHKNSKSLFFKSDFYDEQGNKYNIKSFMFTTDTSNVEDGNREIQKDNTQYSILEFILEDYTDDIIYLSPNYSKYIQLEEPVVISVY